MENDERTIFVEHQSLPLNWYRAHKLLTEGESGKGSPDGPPVNPILVFRGILPLEPEKRVLLVLGPNQPPKLYRIVRIMPLVFTREGDEGASLVAGKQPVKVCRRVDQYVLVEPE